MGRLDSVDTDELKQWLQVVRGKESTQMLMAAIAVAEGVDPAEVEDWFDMESETIDEWLHTLESESTVVAIASSEGADIQQLADWYSLSPTTVREWFETLEDRSPAEAIEIIDRYSQESSAPVFGQKESRVEYIDYEAIEANGWSVEDDDLFEKAAREGLPPEQYGRILVEPGETILEAAENRGFSWPYACRGGACANCAVLVKEGDIAMPGDHILTNDQVSRMNARLTCVGVPVTDTVKIVMNVQALDQFESLRLPSPLSEV